MHKSSNRRVVHLLSIIFSVSFFLQAHALEVIANIENGPNGIDTSADGRYVVYATPLKEGSVNSQVFLLDRDSGETIVVSRNSRGEDGDKTSFDPSISSDGSYIVFSSNADNLIDNDQNPSGADATEFRDSYIGQDIYGYDVTTGVIELLSKDSSGVQAQGISHQPKVSEDGRVVLFRSLANNLVADDQNLNLSDYDAFIHDRESRETILINRNAQGIQSLDGAGPADLSGDGSKIVFTGGNGLLDNIGTLTSGQIFMKDWQTGEIELISQTPGGEPIGPNSFGSLHPSVSRTGDVVAYITYALDFVSSFSDRESYARLALYDRQTRMTSMVSARTETAPSLGDVKFIDLSEGGQYLAFTTASTGILDIDQDIPPGPRAFLYDRNLDTIIQSDSEGFPNGSLLLAGRSVAVPARRSEPFGNPSESD